MNPISIGETLCVVTAIAFIVQAIHAAYKGAMNTPEEKLNTLILLCFCIGVFAFGSHLATNGRINALTEKIAQEQKTTP